MNAIYLGLINLVLVLGLVVFRRDGETIIQNVMRRFEYYMRYWFLLGLLELLGTVAWYLWFAQRPGLAT
jgi:hypothetical protein